jgi:hypothetical protein
MLVPYKLASSSFSLLCFCRILSKLLACLIIHQQETTLTAQRRYKREDVQYIRNHLHAGKRRRPAKQISGKDFHWL